MMIGEPDEWGVPVNPLTPREALDVRVQAAEQWGTVPEGLVVSQLGYPVVPEGQVRDVGGGRWIPATISRHAIAHPAWWLEGPARVRWAGEDDDEYAGRVYWDLRGRDLIDEHGHLIDVLWAQARIDVSVDEDWQRVQRWLIGDPDDELSRLELPAGDPKGGSERAAMCRDELEERLQAAIEEELEATVAEVGDAMDRFEGSTPDGVCEALVHAVKAGNREQIAASTADVCESLQAATRFLGVLTDALGEPAPRDPAIGRIGDRLAAYLAAGSRRAIRVAGRALIDECVATATWVCDAGNQASARLMAWRPEESPVPRNAGLTVDRVFGPPSRSS